MGSTSRCRCAGRARSFAVTPDKETPRCPPVPRWTQGPPTPTSRRAIAHVGLRQLPLHGRDVPDCHSDRAWWTRAAGSEHARPRRRRRHRQRLAPGRAARRSGHGQRPHAGAVRRRPPPCGREGFRARLGRADAEHLPFPDASFDVVMSSIGVMFAPHHQPAADELGRVCRPGGTIGAALLDPRGLARRAVPHDETRSAPPPPPGAQPPPLWGSEDASAPSCSATALPFTHPRGDVLEITAFDPAPRLRRALQARYGPTSSPGPMPRRPRGRAGRAAGPRPRPVRPRHAGRRPLRDGVPRLGRDEGLGRGPRRAGSSPHAPSHSRATPARPAASGCRSRPSSRRRRRWPDARPVAARPRSTPGREERARPGGPGSGAKSSGRMTSSSSPPGDVQHARRRHGARRVAASRSPVSAPHRVEQLERRTAARSACGPGRQARDGGEAVGGRARQPRVVGHSRGRAARTWRLAARPPR